jgi:hypothetical protein
MTMDMGWMVPVGVVAAISARQAFVIWVRAKHGYPIGKDKDHDKGDMPMTRENELLRQENERLTGKVDRLEERLSVLERIATDPAERTAREIEALR